MLWKKNYFHCVLQHLTCIEDSKFSSVNERFEYVLKINMQYFELAMQKEIKYVGLKVVILNFQLCHVTIFLF